MNAFESYLDERDERRESAEAEAPKARIDWMLAHADPAERLLSFDRWIFEQLEKRLIWPVDDDDAKAKRIFQCSVEIQHMLTQLFARGWLLDGKRLAHHVIAVLDSVAKAQRAGQVRGFWPYFQASVRRYVGTNSEEIQAEAKRAGNIMGNVLEGLGVKRSGSIVELIATRRSEINESKQTLREKVSIARAAHSSIKASAEQLPLL